MNIKVLMAGMTVVMAFAVVAMPSKAELNTAQKLVAELMESKVAEFKAKKISAEEIGDASMGYVKEAETEAVKFLLLKGAIGFYARGENYDKAADAFTMLKKSVKDIPPSVQEDILSKAANRISAKKAPKLFAMYKTVKVQVGAATVMKQLALQLNKSPNDFKLRRKYAEAVAASGDWDAAIKEFSKVEEPYGGYAKKEAAGKVNNAAQAEFWWAYEPLSDNYDDIFKMHAAQFYRNAIAGGEITGIKKNIVAKRLASIGEDVSAEFAANSKGDDDVETDNRDNADEGKTIVVGNEVEEYPQPSQILKKGAVLSGTQKADVLELTKKESPYILSSVYIVPKDKELKLSEGAVLVCERGSKLDVQGSLEVAGSMANPVQIKGAKAKVDFWQGIHVGRGGRCDVMYAIISDAHEGIQKDGSGSKISNCSFVRNREGVLLWEGSGTIEECYFTKNEKCGFAVHCGRYEARNCTFTDNPGDAVHGWSGVKLESCVVMKNGAGIVNNQAGVEGHNCIIMDNKKCDINVNINSSWNFSGCYWGPVATQMLEKRGDGVNLPKIIDAKDDGNKGVVDISEFLKKPPKDCGATEYPKVK